MTPGEEVIDVKNSDDIVAARQAGHQLARDLGFSLTDVTMIATAISEIARNITSYAGSGAIRVAVADRDGRKALVVRAEDEGPGIVDIERALEDGYSTGRGLGLGLPGARRLMDRLIVDPRPAKARSSRCGSGSRQVRRKGWIGPIEWAAARRPLPGEEVCGDFPIAVDVGGAAALFGVADGLGHGSAAETAALRAEEIVVRCRAEPLDVQLQLCHRGLTNTRGAAITLARVDFETGTLSWIGIGNVTADLIAKSAAGVKHPSVRTAGRRHSGVSNSSRAGHPSSVDRRQEICSSSPPTASSKTTSEAIDFAAPAMAIAEHILDAYSRESDDALVLAARHRGVSS